MNTKGQTGRDRMYNRGITEDVKAVQNEKRLWMYQRGNAMWIGNDMGCCRTMPIKFEPPTRRWVAMLSRRPYETIKRLETARQLDAVVRMDVGRRREIHDIAMNTLGV